MKPGIDDLSHETRTGLVYLDYYGHRRDYSFAEVVGQSQRYAAVLRALGVGSGERVALCNANTAKCLFLILALQRLGAAAVLCGEDLDDDALRAQLEHSGASTLVTNRRRRPRIEWVENFLPVQTRYVLLGEEREGWARMDTLARSARPFAGTEPRDGDAAFVFDDTAVNYAELEQMQTTADSSIGLGRDDCLWSALPFGSRAWIAFALLGLRFGCASIVHEAAFEAHERLELLHELEVTVLCQPASEFEALLALPELRQARLRRVRRFIALNADEALALRWEEATGKPLILWSYRPVATGTVAE